MPGELAAAARMPDDLDANAAADHNVPDVARRRTAAWVYVAAGALTVIAAGRGVSDGLWALAVVFALVAAYHFAAGRRLAVREDHALDVANQATEFPVGHASATLGFRGPLGRPVWNILIFSADDPPSARGLVRVDAYDGSVLEKYVEAIEADES